MGASRLRPLTVKEIQKLTATTPSSIKHRSLGGVPGFVLVHTPAGYTGYGLIYRARGERKKLTLGSTKMLTLAEARIPAERYKNGLSHTVYLTDAMLDVLNAVPRFKDVDLLFPAVGNASNPMSGDQKVKDRIDKLVRKGMVEAGTPEPDNWCVHDFRRTIATGLQRLGFRPDIADQVIGHVGSTRRGAGVHYLHHGYDEERKEALEIWSQHILHMV